MLEVQVPQVELGAAVRLLRPLEEGSVPVGPPPAEGGGVEGATGGPAGQGEGRAPLR